MEFEYVLGGNRPSQGLEVLQKCGEDAMGPPQADGGVKSRDVFPCIPKDLPDGFPRDGGDRVVVITISYCKCRDAEQVGL